ncbi:MAG: hypothetical protein V4660_05890 [Pseudomonadota bacterium]
MLPPPSNHQADYSIFIYYHPSTKGSAGRAVFIDPQLLVRFMELVDSLGAKGLEVARKIIELQSTAAGITADSNKSNAGQHRQTIQNIVVTYTVLQSGGRGAGVYITDLQHGFLKDEGRPGLYKAEQGGRGQFRWQATPDDNTSMPHMIGVLGAVAPSELGVTNASETASTFAAGVLQKERISKGFSLFYTPTYVMDNVGIWLTSDQKQTSGSGSCASSFARLLENTAKKSPSELGGERHKWFIVGQGAKVFQQALREYKQHSTNPLNRSHEFYFVDPQVPLGLLKQDLRNNGIDLDRDHTIVDGSMSLASQTHQLLDSSQVYCNLSRTAERFMALNAAVKEANKVLNMRGSSTVCFSDIVKNLTSAMSALKGKW